MCGAFTVPIIAVQAEPKPLRGKQYVIEAFLELKMNAELEPMVLVKYEEHDDAAWEPFAHMKAQLSAAVLKRFMDSLTWKPTSDSE